MLGAVAGEWRRKAMTQDRSPGKNWAGNYTYRAEKLHRPTTIEQVQEIVANAPSVRVLGSRHSFNDIADSSELISLETLTVEEGLPADIVVDHDAQTVSFGGGVKYGELVETLNDEGVALHNLASLPHISVAGAVATTLKLVKGLDLSLPSFFSELEKELDNVEDTL
jgi:xylitol oxidase